MSIKENYLRILESILESAERCGRRASDITLCAVTKFFPIEFVNEAYEAGARVFGESRVQEMHEKFKDYSAFHKDAEIHMIGALQTNKVKKALSLVSCVQSVDRDDLILELQKHAAVFQKTIKILFEINSGEDSKSGYKNEELFFKGIETALNCGGLKISGLMTIAPFSNDETAVRRAFRGLANLREKARLRYPEADWTLLSMGMSSDYKIAIEEGSTMVRIGSAIFGERT